MTNPDDLTYDDEPLPAQPPRPEPTDAEAPLSQSEIREAAEAEHAAHNAGHPEFELSGTPEGPCCSIGSDEALAKAKPLSDGRIRLREIREQVDPGSLRTFAPELVEVPCPWCSNGQPHPTGFGAPHEPPTERDVSDMADSLRMMLAGLAKRLPRSALFVPGQIFGVPPQDDSASDDNEPLHSVPGGRVRILPIPSTTLSPLSGGFGMQGGFVLVVDLITEAELTHEVEHAWMAHGQAMGALTVIISAAEVELPRANRSRR